MKPGDVRLFEGGPEGALVAAFGIWAERKGKHIRIDMTGDRENFRHIAVTNNPQSVMYHRTLFRDLRRLLIAYSKWPFGDEGAETEK